VGLKGSLRTRRYLHCAAAGLTCLAAASIWAQPSDEVSAESAIKAAYLYKFAPFVRWPAGAFESRRAPFTICIAGPDPFGQSIADTAQGHRVGSHPIVVRRVEAQHPGVTCQILFAGGEAEEEALQAVAHEPVLTVTDHGHGGMGGMIQFVMVAGRVRFAIDEGAAQQNGIAISSKLLGLAVSVTR
jgi:hypothetical protein